MVGGPVRNGRSQNAHHVVVVVVRKHRWWQVGWWWWSGIAGRKMVVGAEGQNPTVVVPK